MTILTYGAPEAVTTLYDMSQTVKNDALTLICGTLLGAGASRQTYEYAPNPKDTVIKVELNVGWHQNSMEWHVWTKLKEDTSKRAGTLRDWFAPVHRMSDMGVWLLMERTAPVTLTQRPHRLPRLRNLSCN